MTHEPLARRHDLELQWHEAHADISDDEQISLYKQVVLKRMRDLQWRMLGAVTGKRVLDVGCGVGREAVTMARMGARVVGIDLTPALLERARLRAAQAGVTDRITFRVGAAEVLADDDERFDIVIGNGILHHLDFRTFKASLVRLMKAGGVAQFQEPLVHNPLLRLYRLVTPGIHSPTERALAETDVREFAAGFQDVRIEYFNLLGLLLLPLPYLTGSAIASALLAATLTADRAVESVLPALRRLSQYVIIQVSRPQF